MNDRELDITHFHELLQQRRVALLDVAQTGESSAVTVVLDQSCVGRLSRMDAMQAQAMSRETNRRREVELRQIGAALRRIEDGEFGDCLECGKPIPLLRLQYNPAVALCVPCA
ncbi:MAG TPA: TraR/DksA C4-type zinc finger protein [Gammaproteobacteria bacterium]